MKRGLVSVIMSAHNAGQFIGDSIRSILDQTYEDWDLIIINDCSSDDTAQVIGEFSKDNPRIKLINNKENLGPYPSANIGLEYARGEFIARLDADDVSYPLRLEKQVNFLNTHPDTVLVGSGGYVIDSSGHKVRKINAISRDSVIRKLMLRVNLFIHSSILARREVLEEMEGYREKFRYVGDYDLYLRLSDKYKLSNIVDHLVGWRSLKTGITMEHHILQRIYADIARELAFERKEKGYDSYALMDMDAKINTMKRQHYGRYLCDHGVYQVFFGKQNREGLGEILKGIKSGGFPYNAMMRGVVQVIAKL